MCAKPRTDPTHVASPGATHRWGPRQRGGQSSFLLGTMSFSSCYAGSTGAQYEADACHYRDTVHTPYGPNGLFLTSKPFRASCLFYTPNRGLGSLLLHNGRFREGMGLGQRAAAGKRLSDLNFQAKWAHREHVLVAQHGALDASPV